MQVIEYYVLGKTMLDTVGKLIIFIVFVASTHQTPRIPAFLAPQQGRLL